MTVSKIFILGKNEVLPTLMNFMESSSIPKKYGGKLDWAWGDMPDLDDEIREALERDGNKGWVKGPALWLNNERVVVGSENGKARRSDKEIAEKKPIVYAADYTEEPVHPNKRASVVSHHRKSLAPHGKTSLDKPRSDSPSTLVEGEAGAAAVAAAATAATANATAATATPAPPASSELQPATPKKQALPSHFAVENVRTSPMGDSQVHLPDAQPAAPATTAEYISPTITPQHPPTTGEGQVPTSPQIEPVSTTSVAAAASVAPTRSSTEPAAQAAPHPAGHAQPGPLSNHQTQLNRKIATQLQNESTIEIPAEANGVLPHPAIIASSDKAKGLAMEEDKLALNGKLTAGHATRPQPERFVTAAEF